MEPKKILGSKLPNWPGKSLIMHLILFLLLNYAKKNKPYLDTLLLNDYPYINSSVDCWNCFYSKYPLTDWEIIEDDEGKGVGTYKSKVGLGKDTLVLYGCHLASNNYSADNKYITPDSINSHKDLKQYFSDGEASVLLTDEIHCLKLT